MCHNTEEEYQNFCHEVVRKVDDSSSNDPKAYINTAVDEIRDSINNAINMMMSGEFSKQNDKGINMAIDGCKEVMESALRSIDLVSDVLDSNNDINYVQNQSPDLKNWLSSVISYQQSCVDIFEDGNEGELKIKEELQKQSLDRIEKLSVITLDIVTGLAKIVQDLGLNIETKPSSFDSGRVLSEEEGDDDNEGFPDWISPPDRMLLAKDVKFHVPNVVVAKDGSGNFKTVQGAINSYPKGKNFQGGRFIIYVKGGIYKENCTVPSYAMNIFMYGDGPTKTIITASMDNATMGLKTMHTATFVNKAGMFLAKDMRFENAAGPEGHQAVALRNVGDFSAFFNCHIHGYQDTLYVQANRQFYRNCEIAGTVDFIFGTSLALIQRSKLIVRKPLDSQFNILTADGTVYKNMTTGIVIQGCEIVPDPLFDRVKYQVKTYLGRPWKEGSRTIIMESYLGDWIDPEGWAPHQDNEIKGSVDYSEYGNTGPGASIQGRIKWKSYRGMISKNEAKRFTLGEFLKGGPDNSAEKWLTALGVPFESGFLRP
ncbi:hypothetical protein PIB30_019808 [Stylosanthes scabra]|uniref:Pectinesterase n=1 Tax=Stylosanthes scabra TaxID=79078 RepID=A0ABU6Q8T7_9FABA|nr:hypothetical protein [Stylosanthes scabra]